MITNLLVVDYWSLKILVYLLFIWRGMLWYVNHNSTWPLVVFNVNKILFEFLSAPRAVLYNWLYQNMIKVSCNINIKYLYGIFWNFTDLPLGRCRCHCWRRRSGLAWAGVYIYNQMVPFIGVWAGSSEDH